MDHGLDWPEVLHCKCGTRSLCRPTARSVSRPSHEPRLLSLGNRPCQRDVERRALRDGVWKNRHIRPDGLLPVVITHIIVISHSVDTSLVPPVRSNIESVDTWRVHSAANLSDFLINGQL